MYSSFCQKRPFQQITIKMLVRCYSLFANKSSIKISNRLEPVTGYRQPQEQPFETIKFEKLD